MDNTQEPSLNPEGALASITATRKLLAATAARPVREGIVGGALTGVLVALAGWTNGNVWVFIAFTFAATFISEGWGRYRRPELHYTVWLRSALPWVVASVVLGLAGIGAAILVRGWVLPALVGVVTGVLCGWLIARSYITARRDLEAG